MEILEEVVMKEEMDDTPKEDPSKPCTKSCYSCGEGHISQNCMNGDLVELPTKEVEYDPQEIEAMIGTEKVQEKKQIGFQEGPESYHLLQVQGVRALPQQLPKKETLILVRSNMFQL